MQYEKAYAEVVVFGGEDVIVTSPGGLWDSSEEWPDDFKPHDGKPGRPGFPGRPDGGRHHR